MQTHDSTPERVTVTDEDYERVLLQAVVLKKANGIHKAEKDRLAKALHPGDSHKVVNAQGLNLGSVSMSVPAKKAVCTDNAILCGIAMDKGLELIDAIPGPSDPRHMEIINLLLEQGREDLLDTTVVKEDREELEKEILEQWQITGDLPTGWEIKEASISRMTVTAGRSDAAKAAVNHMLGEVANVLELTDGKDN